MVGLRHDNTLSQGGIIKFVAWVTNERRLTKYGEPSLLEASNAMLVSESI